MRWIKTEDDEILNINYIIKIYIHERANRWLVAADTKMMFCIIKGEHEDMSKQQALEYLNKIYEGLV